MKVLYGAGVLGASGSMGGMTASHNRFGSYWRSRTTPVNPNTQRQNKIRAAVQLFAPQWSGVLTLLQREAWEVYAAAITRTGSLGQQIKLTGYNMFMRSNVIRNQSDLTAIIDAPTILTLPPADPIMVGTIDEASQQISVAFDDSLDWVDQSGAHLIVFMSMPVAAGRAFIGGPWRLAGTIDGDDTTAPTSPEVMDAPFPVAAGQVIAIRARISEVDGRLSDLFRNQGLVIAGS